MQMRVVLFSGRCLFAEEMASCLREFPQRFYVCFVDPQQPDYFEQINAIQPAAIVIDVADVNNSQFWSHERKEVHHNKYSRDYN